VTFCCKTLLAILNILQAAGHLSRVLCRQRICLRAIRYSQEDMTYTISILPLVAGIPGQQLARLDQKWVSEVEVTLLPANLSRCSTICFRICRNPTTAHQERRSSKLTRTVSRHKGRLGSSMYKRTRAAEEEEEERAALCLPVARQPLRALS